MIRGLDKSRRDLWSAITAMTNVIKKNRFKGCYLCYFPTVLIGIFLSMPFTLSFISALIPEEYLALVDKPPDWSTRWILQIWAIPAVVDEFLLSRGFLPGPEELYLDPVFPPTALGWFVGVFVILAGTFFINYI